MGQAEAVAAPPTYETTHYSGDDDGNTAAPEGTSQIGMVQAGMADLYDPFYPPSILDIIPILLPNSKKRLFLNQ
jgi:hypothetical protein